MSAANSQPVITTSTVYNYYFYSSSAADVAIVILLISDAACYHTFTRVLRYFVFLITHWGQICWAEEDSLSLSSWNLTLQCSCIAHDFQVSRFHLTTLQSEALQRGLPIEEPTVRKQEAKAVSCSKKLQKKTKNENQLQA